MKKGYNQYDLFDSKLLSGITTLAEMIQHRQEAKQSLLENLHPSNNKLTVLSFGGGQDSTALLYLYINSKDFRKKYAPYDFIVIMSDTGDEHPETYAHLKEVKQLCRKYNIPFYLLTKEQGYHQGNWSSLRDFYRATSTCGSKAFRKNCTDNLKIKPIHRFLEEYIYKTYKLTEYGRKKAFLEFAEKFGKINMVIGIAKGEEKRIGGSDMQSVWEAKTIRKVFPLVELGMDRKSCQDYIRNMGMKVPHPSNCMICPYMSEIELLWLYNNYPNDFYDWVQIEKNKIEKFKDREVNLGVWVDGLLEEKLKEAQKKYGHMSEKEINEYKFSHGHCVKSKY